MVRKWGDAVRTDEPFHAALPAFSSIIEPENTGTAGGRENLISIK
jgi:hypothetical protein